MRIPGRRRAWLLATLAALAALALAAGCGGDDSGDRLADDALLPTSTALLPVTSPAFIDRSRLPQRYTCDGDGDEPPVQAGSSPPSADELVLLVTDADAPGGTFVHVTRYGLSPRGRAMVDHGGREGRNSAGTIGWTPPCPPEGSGTHHYVWSVYALDHASGLAAGASPAEVAAALRSGVLASGSITALYSR